VPMVVDHARRDVYGAETTCGPSCASRRMGVKRWSLATRDELSSPHEQLALAGFLAGYSGLTRDAYTLETASCPPVLIRPRRPWQECRPANDGQPGQSR
jgi:hypothetical protein